MCRHTINAERRLSASFLLMNVVVAVSVAVVVVADAVGAAIAF